MQDSIPHPCRDHRPPDGAEAWRVAHKRFPEDRKGQLTHQLAMTVSDSSWHHQLSETAKEANRITTHTGWCLSKTTRPSARI